MESTNRPAAGTRATDGSSLKLVDVSFSFGHLRFNFLAYMTLDHLKQVVAVGYSFTES